MSAGGVSDGSGDVNDGKLTTGYYFKMKGRCAALRCGFNKQIAFTLYISEAEYRGMAAAVQEAVFLKQFLEVFSMQQKHPIAMGKDNQSSIRLCQNPVKQKMSKHIETRFHFIQNQTEYGTFSIHYVTTDKMAADIFTKSLMKLKMETFRTAFMGADSTESNSPTAQI